MAMFKITATDPETEKSVMNYVRATSEGEFNVPENSRFEWDIEKQQPFYPLKTWIDIEELNQWLKDPFHIFFVCLRQRVMEETMILIHADDPEAAEEEARVNWIYYDCNWVASEWEDPEIEVL